MKLYFKFILTEDCDPFLRNESGTIQRSTKTQKPVFCYFKEERVYFAKQYFGVDYYVLDHVIGKSAFVGILPRIYLNKP